MARLTQMLCGLLCSLLLVGTGLAAQTLSVTFTASPDHAAVNRYALTIQDGPEINLGLPTPDAQNRIALDATITPPMPAGTYLATLGAMNDLGRTESEPVPFVVAYQDQSSQIQDRARQIKDLADQIIELAQPSPTPSPTPIPTPTPPPPQPVDCVVSAWGEWVAGPWTPTECPANGQQSRTETRVRTIVTAPANGGLACPALTETRTVTQSCTPPPIEGFAASFWNYTGTAVPTIPTTTPVLTRVDPAIAFEWGNASPGPGVNADKFLARWTKTQTLAAGNYLISTRSDDGVRVFLDGAQVINHWNDHAPAVDAVTRTLTAGSHAIVVEFYENLQGAVLSFSMTLQPEPTPTPTPAPTPSPTPPPPTAGVIARMNCLTDYPRCGMTGLWETAGAPYAKALVTATPKGFGGIKWTAAPTATQSQPYAGWGLDVSHPVGAVRYFRFNLFVDSTFNAAGTDGPWTDKLVIHGNGSTADRVICVIAPRVGMADLWLRCAKGIDSYPNGTQDVQLRIGQWNAIQVEVGNGANARIKVWVNATRPASVSSPTQASEAMALNLPTATMIGLGFYWNAVIAPGGSLGLTVGDFEWADSFDANW